MNGISAYSIVLKNKETRLTTGSSSSFTNPPRPEPSTIAISASPPSFSLTILLEYFNALKNFKVNYLLTSLVVSGCFGIPGVFSICF
jgi:hypothetical protein